MSAELDRARAEVARLEALEAAHPREALARAAHDYVNSRSVRAIEEGESRGYALGLLESAALEYARALGWHP